RSAAYSNKPSSNSCREKPTNLRSSSMTRSPSVRYCQILTFSENRLLVPAFSSTADGQRGTPRRASADGVTRLPSPLPYVFHLQGIAPKLLTHSGARRRSGERPWNDGKGRQRPASARWPAPKVRTTCQGENPLVVSDRSLTATQQKAS